MTPALPDDLSGLAGLAELLGPYQPTAVAQLHLEVGLTLAIDRHDDDLANGLNVVRTVRIFGEEFSPSGRVKKVQVGPVIFGDVWETSLTALGKLLDRMRDLQVPK